MNILHISPYFPSTDANHAGGVCMGMEIETLRKYHQVYVLTFEAAEFDKKLKDKYAEDSRYHSVRITKFHRLFHMALEPWMPNYFAARSSLRFAWKMITLIRRYHIDAVHAEYASMGQYLWIRNIFPGLQFNMTEHDMTAQSYERKLTTCHGLKRLYVQNQLNKVLRKEQQYCSKVDHLFTFNEKDRRLIAERYHRPDCLVLNPYYGISDEVLDEPLTDRISREVCFLGQMGRDENYLAAMRLIRIAKEVKPQFPDLQVYIVGNQPPEDLKAQENEYIHVTGFVDDVDIYLRHADIAVFPLTLGAGIKLKVLRSLAMGTPVITTSVGAEGIDEDGQVVKLAESDEEIKKALTDCLTHPERLQLWGERSRKFVKTHFGWKKSEEVLADVYGG
jgi:glycosyltransferase involved in cell wall biosynthesis